MGIPPSVQRGPKDQATAGCLLHEGHCHKLGEFPENLQWESLVDVLRGHAKINNHCYEAVEFDSMIRVRSITTTSCSQ